MFVNIKYQKKNLKDELGLILIHISVWRLPGVRVQPVAMHRQETEEQAHSPPGGYSRPFLAEVTVHSAGELGRE